MGQRVRRIELPRASHRGLRFGLMSRLRERVTQEPMRVRVAGIEVHCQSERRLRGLPVPLDHPEIVSACHLRFRQIGVGADGVEGGGPRARADICRPRIAVDRTARVSEREIGPCEGIVRVDLRAHELNSSIARALPSAVRRCIWYRPLQIRVVGVGVLRLPAPETAHPIGRQSKPDLLGDGGAQLLLQSEQAGRLAFVELRPHVLLIPDANQGDRHSQPAILPLESSSRRDSRPRAPGRSRRRVFVVPL